MSTLRVRRSIEELQDEYTAGNRKPLEDVVRAWKGIQELPPTDHRSFFVLGGYHGEPFRGAGWGNASYWGGYCNHGNILFPTWHRVYLFTLEEALRSIPGCEDVTLPFWDETSPGSLANGIPWALTNPTFELDGETIANPLASFTFPLNIQDNIPDDVADYSKPAGYTTVRYPLSGLVGTDKEKAKTEAHNARFPDPVKNVELLNQNIVNWLNLAITVKGTPVQSTGVHAQYVQCLDAPNYTVFSNTTSQAEWNTNQPPVVALESPHNHIHLAVGGYDVPKTDLSPIPGANGDMGENDTAGLDPIFFFHHCFVDRVFWLWQKRHQSTDNLDIIRGYPGTNSVDSQGPTPGTPANSWLDLDSPLDPFVKDDGGTKRPYTSRDCFNIETQLGYTYGPGSLEDVEAQWDALGLEPAAAPTGAAPQSAAPARVVHVSGLNRAAIRGSFLISTFVNVDGERQLLHTEAVLSRWHVSGCANCQTHLQARSAVRLPSRLAGEVAESDVEVEVHTRDGLLGGRAASAGAVEGSSPTRRTPFRVEIR
ncbi:MAG TPA: tyrosinase family protein [Longimicrobium sp.]|nr:tyrosinase family protein [Longimicrobium sp.]